MSGYGVLVSVLILFEAACASQGSAPVEGQAQMPDTVFVMSSDPDALGRTFASIAESVGPSVVTITSRTTVKATIPGFPGFSSPFGFNPWQNPVPEQQEYVMEGLGSGVIVTPDGFIVTNNHVVEGADELEVILGDGTRYPATLVGADSKTDIAIISIEADSLPAFTRTGNSDSLEVGEWVLAIGSPFALSQTVTQGIVSYIGRSGMGLADYESYIQTDAAINPGNSGGALVDMEGRLVGINSAIASRSGGYEGIGFAIPINLVLQIQDDLMAQGFVTRGWLGVRIQELDAGLAAEFGEERGAVLVSDVEAGSPAEDAGIQRGDVILELNGTSVESSAYFRNTISSLDPGSEVSLLVSRDGARSTIRAVLEALPGEEQVAKLESRAPAVTGWVLRDLDTRTAQRLGYDGSEGVVVGSVTADGFAARAGLQQGDVILEVDRRTVSTVDEVDSAVAASGSGALLLVWRQGYTVYLVMPLE